MKWKKCVFIVMAVVFAVARYFEEHNNPITLFKVLIKRGAIAWIELIVITIVIVLPSYFIAYLLDRYTTKFYPQFSTWKSWIYAICSTTACYFVIVTLLDSIKHV